MKFTKVISIVLFSIFLLPSYSQSITDSIAILNSTNSNNSNQSIYSLTNIEKKKEFIKINNNKLFRKQNNIFKAINNEILNGNVILKKGIDYKNFSSEFKIILEWKRRTTEDIYKSKNKNQTFRDLTTTSILLDELLQRTMFWLQKIQNNNSQIIDCQSRLDSLALDESLYITPTDSSAKVIYTEHFKLFSKDLELLDTKITNALDSIQTLQLLGGKLKYAIETDIINYESLRKTSFEKMTTKSESIFVTKNNKSFKESLVYSFTKGTMVFSFYIVNHYNVFILMFLLCLGLYFYLKLLKKKYQKLGLYNTIKNPIVVFNYPMATSILITTTLFQVVIPSPPFAIINPIWLSSIFSLSYIIFKSQKDKVIFNSWFLFLPILFISIQDNLILIYTIVEFWIICFLIISTVLFCLFAIKKRKEINSSFIFYILCFCLLVCCVSLLLIINRNYDLSKIAILNCIHTIFLVITTLYSYYLIQDIIDFTYYLKESDDVKELSTLTENNKKPISKIYYIFFSITWFTTTKRNNYSFETLFDPLMNSFNETRQIGDFSYSYNAIFLFLSILLMSGVIAKVVSFIATDTNSSIKKSKSSGLGSWLLLIRIAIICAGVLIAFASAGIPLDKITIIISALGVGIGFGLQSLINNLVSGLIIAFEKPINLDDIVEINGQTGTMKSIGIRSSVLSTWDGADLIIPNGDLLNNQLTNWTIGSQKRRYEFHIGVAYGTDLKKVKEIIKKILIENHLVLQNPDPLIWVSNFNDSSIDYVIKYWVPHFNIGYDVKSDILIAIDEAFKENGIEIPFPQHDIHIIKNEIEKDKK